MESRRKSGAAEDLMDLVALLPCWLGVGAGTAVLLGAARRGKPPYSPDANGQAD